MYSLVGMEKMQRCYAMYLVCYFLDARGFPASREEAEKEAEKNVADLVTTKLFRRYCIGSSVNRGFDRSNRVLCSRLSNITQKCTINTKIAVNSRSDR